MDSNPIMELIPMDVCLLCDQNTAVLTSHCSTPYMKYMNTTFFEKNKIDLDRFQEAATDKGFCALCAHKIVVSHKFKDIYEETCKKHTSFKKTRQSCFLCESKSGDLIQTDSNPNDFDTKIKSFMKSTLYPRPYLQCASCLDCLFYLNVWFEMNLHLMEKMNRDEQIVKSPEKQSKSTNINRKKMKTPHVNHRPSTRNTTHRTDKENTTPPDNNTHASQKRSRSESESLIEAPKTRKRNFTTVISETEQELGLNCSVNNTAINESNKHTRSKLAKNKNRNAEPTKKLNLFLKRALKHLKSVKKNTNSTKWPENIVEDKKMFDNIPYVLIVTGNNQITSEETENYACESTSKKHLEVKSKSAKKPEENRRRSNRLNKPMEVIELSDTESEANKGNESTEELAGNNPSCSSIKQIRTKTSTPQTPKIKVRMSSSFLFGSTSSSNYTCNVCDQGFKVNCDYKAHCLWHEKPDDVIINITRHNLPEQIKASRFNEPKSPQTSKIQQPDRDTEIDTILRKYVTFSSSDALKDADVSNSKEIENIIENLYSEEEEPSEENNKQEKNIEINITENLNSEEKEQSEENNEQEKNIEINITENLNSEEKEQSEENNEQEKNIEINLEAQSKHEDSKIENDAVEQQHSENEAVSLNTSENDNSKVDAAEVENLKTDKRQQSQTESETEDLENVSEETEDSEAEVDTVSNSISENVSENTNETKTTDFENVSKENKNSEVEEDTTSNSISEKVSENANQTKTTEGHDDTTAENDDVQPEQQESNFHDDDNSVIKETEDIEKQQPTNNEQNSTESNSEDTEDDSEESVIEKQLARMHREESLEDDNNESGDDSNEKEQDHEEEKQEADTQLNKDISIGLKNGNSDTVIDGVTTNNCCNIEDISDTSGETDQANDEKENSSTVDSLKEDCETGNTNINRKRKRVENLVVVDDTLEESSDDVEIVTPKAKKVRFAMDYVKEDHTLHVISDEEEDVHKINNSEDRVQEIEDCVE